MRENTSDGGFSSFVRGEKTVSLSATVLMCAIYALLLLSRVLIYLFPDLFSGASLEADGDYLSTILLQIVIFFVPTYVYLRYKGKGSITTEIFKSRISPRSFRLSHLFLMLASILVLICGCTLLALLCGMMADQSSFTLYDTFSAAYDGTLMGVLRLVLTYGILPAVCEEIIFRGIVCAEYEKYGILYSSLISALFFAFLHFDLSAFPVYLFAGLMLAFVMYVSRSVIAAVVVHLGYNLFGIFAQAGLSGYCRSTGSVGLLVILLIAFLLLGAAFFCGEVARILRGRAESNIMADASETATPGISNLKGKEWIHATLSAFASPAAVLCLVMWLATVIAGFFV